MTFNWFDILKVLLPIVVDIITHMGKAKASRSTEEVAREDSMVKENVASRLRGVASLIEKDSTEG